MYYAAFLRKNLQKLQRAPNNDARLIVSERESNITSVLHNLDWLRVVHHVIHYDHPLPLAKSFERYELLRNQRCVKSDFLVKSKAGLKKMLDGQLSGFVVQR